VIAGTDPDSAEFVAWYQGLATMPGVAGTAIRPDTPHGITVVDITPSGTSQGGQASALVEQLRGEQTSFDTEVGGIAAELIDIKDRLSERLPWAALMVVVATLVLLFLMTGSIIVPIKAVVMNILSLAASFGALAWIFQEGHLAGLIGFDPVGALDLWMPVLILIFAFGLSMDYEVFLLSRIKEVHDETGDNDLAVAVGLQRSGRIITSAALLIVIVFAGFAAGEVLAIKQLGVGLAIAVLVDATIVRTLLVPATMKLLGEWNWWAPAPLRRFHQRFGLHEAPTVHTGEAESMGGTVAASTGTL
jgi:putative drug exporter of the RND superfamily